MGLDPNISIVISWWCLDCTTHRRNCISPQRMHYCRCTDQARLAHILKWKNGGLRPEMLESRADQLIVMLKLLLPLPRLWLLYYRTSYHYVPPITFLIPALGAIKLFCLLLHPRRRPLKLFRAKPSVSLDCTSQLHALSIILITRFALPFI